MLVGYARVSTLDQNPQLQIDALKQAGCERLYVEKASGAHRDRPELQAASNTCAQATPWWSGGSRGWRDPLGGSLRGEVTRALVRAVSAPAVLCRGRSASRRVVLLPTSAVMRRRPQFRPTPWLLPGLPR